MVLQSFRNISAHQKALVAVAVLLDGREGAVYLENDLENGKILQRAARDLAALDVELRVPMAGTALRRSLEELKGGE